MAWGWLFKTPGMTITMKLTKFIWCFVNLSDNPEDQLKNKVLIYELKCPLLNYIFCVSLPLFGLWSPKGISQHGQEDICVQPNWSCWATPRNGVFCFKMLQAGVTVHFHFWLSSTLVLILSNYPHFTLYYNSLKLLFEHCFHCGWKDSREYTFKLRKH